jgi:methanogenic corrinoid protein MtbC1
MSRRGESEVSVHFEAPSGSKQVANHFATRPGLNQEHLASAIFDDIVPRLQMLHHELSAKGAERAFSREEIAEFAETLISDDSVAADQFLHKMRARGHSEDTLFLGLMAETARHLGALWDDDRCSFVDVTIGVARLQNILCVFSAVDQPAFTDGHHRVLLCSLSGERHAFGLDMVACLMRHACWDVEQRKGCEAHDVAEAVARDWFAVLGFTLSAESGLESLCHAIHSGRAASVNPAIGVLVGGPLFRAQPKLVAQVGADAMATDAASASLLAKKLLLRQRTKSAMQHLNIATQNGHAAAHDGTQPFTHSPGGGKPEGSGAESSAQSFI